MIQFRTFFVVLGLGLPSVACSGGDPTDPSPLGSDSGPEASEPVAENTENIWGPTVLGRSAIEVCIEQGAGTNLYSCCSGVILNNQTIVTAAHCHLDHNNGPRNTLIEYQGPNGTQNWSFVNNEIFYYVPDGWNTNEPSEWDVSVGVMGAPNSLGLGSIDFATLYRGGMGGGTHVTQAGYGGSLAGPSGIQRRIVLQVTWNGSQHVKWETDVAAGQMACRGDSGGPGFRTSGYSDASGPYWDAAAWVMRGGLGGGDCDDEGRASKLNSKVDWIEEIIEFWTPWTCADFTTPSNQPASWCWANQ
jgi:hypothetical protein